MLGTQTGEGTVIPDESNNSGQMRVLQGDMREEFIWSEVESRFSGGIQLSLRLKLNASVFYCSVSRQKTIHFRPTLKYYLWQYMASLFMCIFAWQQCSHTEKYSRWSRFSAVYDTTFIQIALDQEFTFMQVFMTFADTFLIHLWEQLQHQA